MRGKIVKYNIFLDDIFFLIRKGYSIYLYDNVAIKKVIPAIQIFSARFVSMEF